MINLKIYKIELQDKNETTQSPLYRPA